MQKDPSSHQRLSRTLDPGQETEDKIVRPFFKVSGLAKTILLGTVKGKIEKRQTEEEVGREDNIKEWTGMDFGAVPFLNVLILTPLCVRFVWFSKNAELSPVWERATDTACHL